MTRIKVAKLASLNHLVGKTRSWKLLEHIDIVKPGRILSYVEL